MPAQIIDGKALAEKSHQQVANAIHKHRQTGLRAPGLAVVLVGIDPASQLYVQTKHKACKKVGIISYSYNLEAAVSESALLDLLDELNEDPKIDGILVQLPLPTHINTQKIVERIRPEKDVDGFHPYNLGRLAQGKPSLTPCTPAGIMEILKSIGVPLKGLNATVIGTSTIVGRPMLLELLRVGCTVTACHSATRDLKQFVHQADLLVVATGNPHLIKGDWIKPNAIVIDVGMNRLDTGRFVGDVEFEEACKKAAWITPVPGGVGPMTVASLLKNTLSAYNALQ